MCPSPVLKSAYAIFEPSFDQRASTSRPPRVRRVRPLPSALTTSMYVLPPTLAARAIFVPSGDQAGNWSSVLPLVSRACWLPSALIVYRSPSLANTILEPAGAHDGGAAA